MIPPSENALSLPQQGPLVPASKKVESHSRDPSSAASTPDQGGPLRTTTVGVLGPPAASTKRNPLSPTFEEEEAKWEEELAWTNQMTFLDDDVTMEEPEEPTKPSVPSFMDRLEEHRSKNITNKE